MRVRKNIAEPVTHMKVKVKILLLRDQNAAVAHAALDMGDGVPFTVEATGSAKREQGDTRDDTIAADLAVGRALIKLGRQLQDTGRSQVKTAEIRHNRERQASLVRRLRRDFAPAAEKLRPIGEIREEYGADAAERAVSRREPHGRHARKNKKG